jgi:hypothetical protein
MSRLKPGAGPLEPVAGELQQMWLQLVQADWSSIVLVPVEPSTSARTIAVALLDMAAFYNLGQLKFVDGIGASLHDGMRLAQELAAAVASGARVVAAVDSPMENGGAVPLVLAADAAVLVIRLGAARLDSARAVIELLGRKRVMGAVALRANGSAIMQSLPT